MTPFKAVYGQEPPLIIQAGSKPSKIEAVNMLVEERDGILDELQANIIKAQNRMKQQVNKKRWGIQSQEGDWVYLKAHPYRWRCLVKRRNQKLSPRYYGYFHIVASWSSSLQTTTTTNT